MYKSKTVRYKLHDQLCKLVIDTLTQWLFVLMWFEIRKMLTHQCHWWKKLIF